VIPLQNISLGAYRDREKFPNGCPVVKNRDVSDTVDFVTHSRELFLFKMPRSFMLIRKNVHTVFFLWNVAKRIGCSCCLKKNQKGWES